MMRTWNFFYICFQNCNTMKIKLSESENAPLQSIEEWEDDLLVRYPEPKDKQAKA